ncbi:LOW QUALITY PROTEIN: mitotic deacetylase associated SANT domain protein a [Trematomus bernacchii]|uniref:LOW QUALITY PROTEIN: mitotic deacetylase associated SANT domain protein a n=1 Tax=Trematomus bernacchii TaxID=40690 RepID=UPI00146D860E|nr:LOW QUALITY PROTEIN: mitotic deacetylase associated SANT domain protein a [Trematomus bernacchii]
MSLPSQVNTDKSGKLRAAAMKEPVQHSGDVYYGMGPPALEPSHSDSASSSAVYNPEKGPQSLPHYQQAAPVKWMHQESVQAPGWSQEAPASAWGQNFGPYGGVNASGQMAFHKGVHEGVALPMGGESQLPGGPVEVYRDAPQAQAQGRGLEWEQHTAAAMHQAQLQVYQHAHKGVELQGQPHAPPPHTLQGPMLQPFQTTFRPSKQQFSSGYYSVFPGNKGIPNLAYAEQPKSQQQQLIHQMQQQQQMHQHQRHQHQHQHQQQQQQQQQQLQQQHHLQLQQQQHLHQQRHQIQQQQIQQQQLQQMQQQYHQQQLQERRQQIQQMQQQQQQNVTQKETTQPQVQPKQQQTQNVVPCQPPEPSPPDTEPKKEVQSLGPGAQTCDSSPVSDSFPEKVATNPAEPSDTKLAAPRRSRRLSREGQSPLGPPSTNIWSQASKDPALPHNGVAGTQVVKGGEATTEGVIRRRRRASKEINLETLAQKASEMESMPPRKQEEGSSGRQASMMPLVMPVSVPVHRSPTDPQGALNQGRVGGTERPAGQTLSKPSVIVARRRSLRKSISESFGQEGENDPGTDEEGKSKLKRRPRPEPLIIPPPKPATFIPPSLYSSISSYQSNLRSPVRMPDNPLTMPPYTPPPILSPVRGGSGLYFSTFLTNIASNQILPPPPHTPKSATRSLLRSTSSDITPPVLSCSLITDATTASLEPRINIGQRYQAEIPDLRDPASSQFDQHKADVVWLTIDDSKLNHGDQECMEDFMNMACCSVLRGGGTNQELVLHCFHESGGDFIETLERLMLQDPVFPKDHLLTGYHYSGSDCWTAEEKRYFNKGISAYRKDFFMVQKLVQSKTVAQCVEFYYTYKKQVKIGRNGILTFGPLDSPDEKHTDAVVDVKCDTIQTSQQSNVTQGETDGDDKKDVSYGSSQQALQTHDYAGTVLVIKEPHPVKQEAPHAATPHRPRAEPAAKKPRAPPKPPVDPDATFPCKKCGRVFYKVKSRSAHMKSHAEQEKKAAALRHREEEEQAAAEARARKAAAAVAAAAAAVMVAANQGGNGNGVTEPGEVSSQEDSSEEEDDKEDDKDEDWR